MYLWSATVFHLMQVQDDIVDEEIGQFTGPDPLQTLHTYVHFTMSAYCRLFRILVHFMETCLWISFVCTCLSGTAPICTF